MKVNEIGMTELYIPCTCGSLEHVVRFSFFETLEDEEEDMYLSISLVNYRKEIIPNIFNIDSWRYLEPFKKDFWEGYFRNSVFKKIQIGFKYLFGFKEEKDGIFDCVDLDCSYYDQLEELLLQFSKPKNLKTDVFVSRIPIEISNGNYILNINFGNTDKMGIGQENEEYKEIFTSVQFKEEKNVLKRLYIFLKYIFGRYNNEGCCIMNKDNASRLIKMIEKIECKNGL